MLIKRHKRTIAHLTGDEILGVTSGCGLHMPQPVGACRVGRVDEAKDAGAAV